MAMGVRKAIGYGLVIVGLLLLFDTATFLRTNWSPLRVPMAVSAELCFGYAFVAAGIAVLFFPASIGFAARFAPGSGEGIATREERYEHGGHNRRLPLKRQLAALPNRGVIGGGLMLLLLIPLFAMNWDAPKIGIYVFLSSTPFRMPTGADVASPIILRVKRQGTSTRFVLNGNVVVREELESALKKELSRRAPEWFVFVEGDPDLAFGEPMYAVNAINNLHARAVLLTSALKQAAPKYEGKSLAH